MDNLRKRNLIVINWCYMCKKKSEESIDHPLIHCKTAYALWSSIFDLYGLKWVMTWRVVDLFKCWRGQQGSSQKVAVWKISLAWCDVSGEK